MEAQGYQMFPLSNPVAGQTIALHAAPAGTTGLLTTDTELVALLIHSFHFISPPNLLRASAVKIGVVNGESEFYMW